MPVGGLYRASYHCQITFKNTRLLHPLPRDHHRGSDIEYFIQGNMLLNGAAAGDVKPAGT